MAATYRHRRQEHGLWGGVASLLAILFLVHVARPWAGALPPGDLSVPRLAPRPQVAVHQGRLSVNHWEADIREVLVQIQQQSGIPISVSPGPEHKVSAQFTDVALDQGLRRLLQLASQSYAMHYASGPTGEVILQEVQVFRKAPAGDQSPAGAAQGGRSPSQRSASASSTPCCSAKSPLLQSHAKTRATRSVSERRWSARLRQPSSGPTHQPAMQPVAS
jgi:type II secretory pathway component GspD/PulD (secretin)